MLRVTITAYGGFSVKDYIGDEVYQLDNQFVGMSFSPGDVGSFECTVGQYETSFRKQLEKLADQRIPITGTTRTQPMMTYDVESVPNERPRFHQIEGGALSLGGGAQDVTIRGTNLIAGRKATGSIGTGTSKLTFTAARKGPIGEKITVNLLDPGSASVTIVHGQDGEVTINVVPSSGGGGTQANTIAAQFSGAVTNYVTCAGGGTGVVRTPVRGIKLSHEGRHVGSSQAFVDLKTTVARTRLRVECIKPGNKGNRWSVAIAQQAGGGGGSVTVNATNRTLVVVPASGAGNANASVVRDQINNDATAQKHLKASVIGTNGDAVVTTSASTAIPATYMYGGCGEEVSATIGGAAADVMSYDDNAVVLRVTGTALGNAGCAAGESAVANVLIDAKDVKTLSAQVDITA